jgi:hypothetical protein
MVMFTLEQNNSNNTHDKNRNCGKNDICGKNQSYSVHTGHTGEIVSAVKDYLLRNPVSYSGDVDSLLEMIYFRYTEYNPVENERVKSCFLGFLEKLHNLLRDEEEENQMIDLVGNACAEYERTAYMEGVKVGIRLMIEVMEESH